MTSKDKFLRRTVYILTIWQEEASTNNPTWRIRLVNPVDSGGEKGFTSFEQVCEFIKTQALKEQ